MGIIELTWQREPGYYGSRLDILPILGLISEKASLCHIEFTLSFRGQASIIISVGVWKSTLGCFMQTLS